MEKKRIIILTVFSVILLAGFLFYFSVYIRGSHVPQINASNNDTDSHGCLIHLGYTWNETEQTCVREWVSSGNAGRYQNNLGYENLSSQNETNLNWTTLVNITRNGNFTNSTNSTNQTIQENFTSYDNSSNTVSISEI